LIFSGKANPDSLLILLEAANQVLLFFSLFLIAIKKTVLGLAGVIDDFAMLRIRNFCF
jgi:hypothetical protein